MRGQQSSLGINLTGFVQGRGIRPAVAELAGTLQLSGAVWNTSHGVSIHVMGTDVAVGEFLNRLDELLEEFGECQRHSVVDLPETAVTDFQILPASEARRAVGAEQIPPSSTVPVNPSVMSALVPPDTVICAACLNELTDPMDRRYGWAMNGCRTCGPRYSILQSMPWERNLTAMVEWPICMRCASEYHGTGGSRGHSQAISCPDCGPQVQHLLPNQPWKGLADYLRAGQLLLLKGIGGYQLLCDAANELAVQKIRSLKQRPSKPLAVMVPSESWLDSTVTEPERCLLKSRDNSILILRGTAGLSLADSVTAGMATVGVLLPSSGLHFLLLQELHGPMVVTSANDESDPIIFRDEEVQGLLQNADIHLLSHQRQIIRPVDDSVVRVINDEAVTIRAGRGLTPMSLPLSCTQQILALGGQQKVSVSLSNGWQAIMGPHIGSMETLAGRQRFMEHVHDLLTLYRMQPSLIVHDAHPDYFTSHWAGQQSCETMAVQHHHAHVVTGMLEHNLMDPVLGIAFDGSGYGPDGTIWGGEFLLADRLIAQRAGCLRPFGLVGGDNAIQQPWRIAVALLADTFPDMSVEELSSLVCGHSQTAFSGRQHCTPADIRKVLTLLRSGAAVRSTSMGRLFDGIACLILGTMTADFEGSPAMLLEDAGWKSATSRAKSHTVHSHLTGTSLRPFVIQPSATGSGGLRHADWRPVIRDLLEARQEGVDSRELAWLFHSAVAKLVSEFAACVPDRVVVLSGGCFQNRLLCEMVMQDFDRSARILKMPGRLPPNDGGLSAGQLAVAVARLKDQE